MNTQFLKAAKGSFSDYVQVYYIMTGMSCVGGWVVGVGGRVGGRCEVGGCVFGACVMLFFLLVTCCINSVGRFSC